MVCLLIAGCSHFEPVRDPLTRVDELTGYEVRVVTTEGRALRFVLLDVTESHLVGEYQRVRLENVAAVERWSFSFARTSLLFVGLAALYALPALWMY